MVKKQFNIGDLVRIPRTVDTSEHMHWVQAAQDEGAAMLVLETEWATSDQHLALLYKGKTCYLTKDMCATWAVDTSHIGA